MFKYKVISIIVILAVVLGISGTIYAANEDESVQITHTYQLLSNGQEIAPIITGQYEKDGEFYPFCIFGISDGSLRSDNSSEIWGIDWDTENQSVRDMQLMNTDTVQVLDTRAARDVTSFIMDETFVEEFNAFALPADSTWTWQGSNGETMEVFTPIVETDDTEGTFCGLQLSGVGFTLESDEDFTIWGDTFKDGNHSDVIGPFESIYVSETDSTEFLIGDMPRPNGLNSFLVPLPLVESEETVTISPSGFDQAPQSTTSSQVNRPSGFDVSPSANRSGNASNSGGSSNNGNGGGSGNGSNNGNGGGSGNGGGGSGSGAGISVNLNTGTNGTGINANVNTQGTGLNVNANVSGETNLVDPTVSVDGNINNDGVNIEVNGDVNTNSDSAPINVTVDAGSSPSNSEVSADAGVSDVLDVNVEVTETLGGLLGGN